MKLRQTYTSYEAFRSATLQDILRRTPVEDQPEARNIAEAIFNRTPREIVLPPPIVDNVVAAIAKSKSVTTPSLSEILRIEEDYATIIVVTSGRYYGPSVAPSKEERLHPSQQLKKGTVHIDEFARIVTSKETGESRLFLKGDKYGKIPVELDKALAKLTSPSHPYGIIDALLRAGIPEEVLKSQIELWELLSSADPVTLPSSHRNFTVAGNEGKAWHLKLYPKTATGLKEARISSALNFYASRSLPFLVHSEYPEPIEAHGFYLTLQEHKPAIAIEMPIKYWIGALAQFHQKADLILQDQGITIADRVPYRSVDEVLDRIQKTRKHHSIVLDQRRLEEDITYLLETEQVVRVHGNVKGDNRLGHYLVDLDTSGFAPAGFDLALLFMDFNIPRKQWDYYLRLYLTARGTHDRDQSTELKQLELSTQRAAHYVGIMEITGDNMRTRTTETASRTAKLEQQLRQITSYKISARYDLAA